MAVRRGRLLACKLPCSRWRIPGSATCGSGAAQRSHAHEPSHRRDGIRPTHSGHAASRARARDELPSQQHPRLGRRRRRTCHFCRPRLGARSRRCGRGSGLASALMLALVVGVACRQASPARQSAGPAPHDSRSGGSRPPMRSRVWDTDVRADGRGLPPDSGTAIEGAAIYTAQCAACHGADGVHGAVAPFPHSWDACPDDAFPFATDTTAVPTVGNYWPYATTLYDYIHRAMPFARLGRSARTRCTPSPHSSLPGTTLWRRPRCSTARTLPLVRMPARDRFVPDDRTGGPQVR